MKKTFSILLMLVLFLALPTVAGAEKNKWKAESYNFSGVHKVIVTDIEINAPDIYGYIPVPFAQKIVEMALRQAFEKYQIQMTTTDGLNHENETIQPGPLTVKPTVHALGKWSEQKEAYYETRTVYKKVLVKHRNHKDTIVNVPIDETIYHPARTVWHAVANLEFIVSSADGEKVYMAMDDRDRVEDSDTSGMLSRICNDLAEELSHN